MGAVFRFYSFQMPPTVVILGRAAAPVRLFRQRCSEFRNSVADGQSKRFDESPVGAVSGRFGAAGL